MVLIECPECKGEVASKAPSCIHCGFPLLRERFLGVLLKKSSMALSWVASVFLGLLLFFFKTPFWAYCALAYLAYNVLYLGLPVFAGVILLADPIVLLVLFVVNRLSRLMKKILKDSMTS